MRFQCRFPERVKGTVQLVVNGEGYDISVRAELGGRSGGNSSGPAPAPSPPGDDDQDDEDYDDLSPSEEEWNDLGKKDTEKRNKAVAEKSQDASKGKEHAQEVRGGGQGAGGYHSAPPLGGTESRLRFLDEYGSNLGTGDVLASFRQPRSLMVPAASPPRPAELSTDSQVSDPAPEGRVDMGLDPGPAAASVGEPGQLSGDGVGDDDLSVGAGGGDGELPASPNHMVLSPPVGGVVPAGAAESEKAMGKLAATYSRALKKKKDNPLSVRKSSRHSKAAANLSVLEKAKKLAADKNLDSGTPPPTSLVSLPNDKLAHVLVDSCIIFNPSRGSPSEILDLVRARELAQASIAEAALKREKEVQLAAAREAAAQEAPLLVEDPGLGSPCGVAPGVRSKPKHASAKRPMLSTRKGRGKRAGLQ
jgi:hypothetical protein